MVKYTDLYYEPAEKLIRPADNYHLCGELEVKVT